ncbi:ribonuclease H-like domain-containing protein [Tanacetum coccineum]
MYCFPSQYGYGILDHLVDSVASSSTTTPTDPPPKDAEWTKIDFIIRSWIFSTLAPSLKETFFAYTISVPPGFQSVLAQLSVQPTYVSPQLLPGSFGVSNMGMAGLFPQGVQYPTGSPQQGVHYPQQGTSKLDGCSSDVIVRVSSILLRSPPLYLMLFLPVSIRGINDLDIQEVKCYIVLCLSDSIFCNKENSPIFAIACQACDLIYGLKQAPRAWFQRFVLTLLLYGLLLVIILERAHMVGCNSSRTPVDTESKLGDGGTPIVDPTLYRSLASSLQYLTFTRPDITYVVQQIAHWLVARTTRQFTSGNVFFWQHHTPHGPLSAADGFPHSGAEAEYRGVANAIAETCWIRNLLCELHTPLSFATIVYYEMSAVVLVI